MSQPLSTAFGLGRRAFWNELLRAPYQFSEQFCQQEQLTAHGLATMSELDFEGLRNRWNLFRAVPDFRRDSRLAVSDRVEYFRVVDVDGVAWKAPRQQLDEGIFRTPDDPTPML